MADHAECPVPRIDQLHGRLEKAPEHRLKFNFRADADDCLNPRAADRTNLGRPDHRDADRGGRRLPREPPCPSREPDVVVRRTAGTLHPSPHYGWPAGREREPGRAPPASNSGVRFWSLVTAGVNVVPPGLFLLGLGALVLGAWPRRTSTVVYGYLAWSFLIEFAGGVVHTSHWLMDTSVFFHMFPPPATTPDWSSTAVITGLGILGAVLGGILLCHRDQKNA